MANKLTGKVVYFSGLQILNVWHTGIGRPWGWPLRPGALLMAPVFCPAPCPPTHLQSGVHFLQIPSILEVRIRLS